MPNSTLGPVQVFANDVMSINLALIDVQNRLDELKGLRGESIVNDRVRLHQTPVQDTTDEQPTIQEVYALTGRGVPPLQQVQDLLTDLAEGLRPLNPPPTVGDLSLIGTILQRYSAEDHTHEGVNLTSAQVITGIKTLGATGVSTGHLRFDGVTSGEVTVQVADAAGTWALTLPITDGDPGQALLTDGSGVTSWGTPSGIVPTTRTLTFAGTSNQIAVSPTGAQDLSVDRSWTFSLVGPYTPATYTAHGVLVGEATSSIVALAVGATGTVLKGSTGADPAFGTLAASDLTNGTTGTGLLVLQTSPTLITPTLGVATANSLELIGAAAPAAPSVAGHTIVYADSNGRLSWRRDNATHDGFTRTFDATLSQNSVYTLPNIAATTLAGLAVTETFTAVQTFETTSTTGSAQTVAVLQSAGNNAHNGPALDFYIKENTTGTARQAAQITGDLTDGTAGAIKANLVFGTTNGGTAITQRLWLYASGCASLDVNQDTSTAGDFSCRRLWLRDAGAAFDLIQKSVSSPVLTAPHTLTWDVANHEHTIRLGAADTTVIFPTTASDTVAMLGTANVFSVAQEIEPTIAANTSADGLILDDPTAATSGNQQYSPRIRWVGQGWKTDATAASQQVEFIAEVIPAQGTANPTARLAYSSQVNAGGYTNRWNLHSTGAVTVGQSTDLIGGPSTIINKNSADAPLVTTTAAATAFQIVGANSATASFVAQGFAGAPTFIFTRAQGTLGGESAPSSQTLFSINARGWDGTGTPYNTNSAQIAMNAAVTHDSTHHGAIIIFSTTATTASATLVEALRIQATGGISAGTTSDSGFGTVRAKNGCYTEETSAILHSVSAQTGGGTGNVPTLTAGPVTGNPTKWLAFDDAGTTRYIPAW